MLEESDGGTVPPPSPPPSPPSKCGEIFRADVLGCLLGVYFHSLESLVAFCKLYALSGS